MLTLKAISRKYLRWLDIKRWEKDSNWFEMRTRTEDTEHLPELIPPGYGPYRLINDLYARGITFSMKDQKKLAEFMTAERS